MAAALDSYGNVFVTGSTSSFGDGSSDVLLLKYSKGGTLQWAKTWGGAGQEIGRGVATDSDGNVYVVGSTESSGSGWTDVLILKFDNSGSLIWSKTWGGDSYDVGYDIVLDGQGRLYVAAETYSYGCAVALLAFNVNGDLAWTHTWKGPASYDSAYSIARDYSGNLILAGISWDYLVYPHHESILVLKYDANGNLLWSRNWSTSGQENVWGFRAVTTDASGNIYVAGRHTDDGTNDNFSMCDFDLLILKIDGFGNFVWSSSWHPPAGWDTATSIAIDPTGNLIAAGLIDALGSTTSNVLLTFDKGGTLLSALRWAGVPNMYEGNSGFFLAGGKGTLFAVGTAWNNTGQWEAVAGVNGHPVGSFTSPPFSDGSPAGAVGDPGIMSTTVTGVSDVGGGGPDVFLTATTPSQTHRRIPPR